MTESQIVGMILLVLGGLNVVRPDIFMRWQVWSQRVLLGAKYEPSARTFLILRFIGVFFVLFGFLAITGVIQ